MEELKLEIWKGWLGSMQYILHLGEKRKSIAIGVQWEASGGWNVVYVAGVGRKGWSWPERQEPVHEWSYYKAFGFHPKVNGESFKNLTSGVT